MPRAALALMAMLAAAGCTGQFGDVPGLLSDGGTASDGGATCVPRFSGPGEVIASGLDRPHGIAWNGQAIFVTEVGVFNKPYGRVLEIDPADGGVRTLAQNLFAPDAILASPDAVYWSQGTGGGTTGGVFRYPLPNGPAERIDATVNQALVGDTSLAFGPGGLLYATGDRYLMWIPLDGGTSSMRFQGPPGAIVRSAAVEGGDGYFLVSDDLPDGGVDAGVYTVPVDGSSAASRLFPLPGDGQALALEPGEIYWSVQTADGGEIQTASLEDGGIQTLASSLSGPGDLLPIGDELYFADSTMGSPPSPSFLQALTDCSSTAPVPLGPTGVGPGALISPDGGFLLFTSEAGGRQGYVGRLRATGPAN